MGYEGARFFSNVVSESTANPRMLIIHECMGRDSGYLTAATARKYRESLKAKTFHPAFASNASTRDIHAVWIPELPIDIEAEGARLKKIMDEGDNVNIFLSEGSGVHDIVAEMKSKGEEVPVDAFGHVSLAKINPGGYFARAAPSNDFDRSLIRRCAEIGVQSAIDGVSGCMGEDEDVEGTPIRPIEFERIKGGKPFNKDAAWFKELLVEIGQISK